MIAFRDFVKQGGGGVGGQDRQSVDCDLYADFLRGNGDSFRQLVEGYRPLLLRLIRQACHFSPIDADEVLSRTWIEVFLRSLSDPRQKRDFRRWVFTIAAEQSIAFVTEQFAQSIEYMVAESSSEPLSPLESLVQAETATRVAMAVKSLDADQAAMVALVYFDDLTVTDASRRLVVSRRTAYRLLNSAKARLAKELANV